MGTGVRLAPWTLPLIVPDRLHLACPLFRHATFDTRVHANLRINATLSDGLVAGVNSNVVKAEAFFDLAGADGSGYPLMALDGVYNSNSENVFVDLPLVMVNQLAQGNHTIYVHGKDASGNWGSFVTIPLTVEKGIVDTLAPAFFNLQVTPQIVDLGILAPAAAPAAPSVTEVILSGTATDPNLTSNIALVEYFLNGNDPGQGSATPVIPVSRQCIQPAHHPYIYSGYSCSQPATRAEYHLNTGP